MLFNTVHYILILERFYSVVRINKIVVLCKKVLTT